MKHLFTLFICLLSLSQVGLSQSSINDAENYFVQNKVGEKLNHFYAKEGNIEIYFHKDRIELMSEVDGEGQYFFIMLNNVSFDMPEGEGMVSRETVNIEDQAMASILKASTMEKSYFKSIKYVDKLTGESLVISMKGNKIDFDGLGSSPLELKLWGNQGVATSRNQNVQLEEFGKIIELSSKNSQLAKDNSKISFKQGGGNEDTRLQFSITII